MTAPTTGQYLGDLLAAFEAGATWQADRDAGETDRLTAEAFGEFIVEHVIRRADA